MKKNYTEIESIIEERIAELEAELNEGYELEDYEISDIRLETYMENGWDFDPFAEEEEEEEEDYEEEYHYRSIYEQLREVGMSMSDFI